MTSFLGFSKQTNKISENTYLSKSGCTISGNINLNRLPNTTLTNSIAISKKYLTDHLFINYGANPALIAPTMNGNYITNLRDPYTSFFCCEQKIHRKFSRKKRKNYVWKLKYGQ